MEVGLVEVGLHPPPTHLVQTHLDTGANLGKPELCSLAKNNCPWSIHGPIGMH